MTTLSSGSGRPPTQEEQPCPRLHRRVVARPELGQRFLHQPPTSPASSPADRVVQLAGRDPTLVMDDRVSQHDELVQIQGSRRRQIAPCVFRAHDTKPVALHHSSRFQAAMSLAAGSPNLGGGADVHDVKRFGRCPALRNRQPQCASGGQMRESASGRQHQARSLGHLEQFGFLRISPGLTHAMGRTGQVTVPQAPLSEAYRVRLGNRERSAAQPWRQRSSARNGSRLPEGWADVQRCPQARHTSREVAKLTKTDHSRVDSCDFTPPAPDPAYILVGRDGAGWLVLNKRLRGRCDRSGGR